MEMVLIVADLLELKADPTISPEGTVIEARLDKGKGPLQPSGSTGYLRRGDIVQTDSAWGRIRAMIDDAGNQIDAAGPSTAVEVLGFSSVPQPGELFSIAPSEKEARQAISDREAARKEAGATPSRKITLEEMYDRMQMGETPVLSIVLKCDVQGYLEALKAQKKIETDEVGIQFVHGGVGRIRSRT